MHQMEFVLCWMWAHFWQLKGGKKALKICAFSVDLAWAGVRMAHISQILHRFGKWKVAQIFYVCRFRKKHITVHLGSEFSSHALCLSCMKLGPQESRENILTHIQVSFRLTYILLVCVSRRNYWNDLIILLQEINEWREFVLLFY